MEVFSVMTEWWRLMSLYNACSLMYQVYSLTASYIYAIIKAVP